MKVAMVWPAATEKVPTTVPPPPPAPVLAVLPRPLVLLAPPPPPPPMMVIVGAAPAGLGAHGGHVPGAAAEGGHRRSAGREPLGRGRERHRRAPRPPRRGRHRTRRPRPPAAPTGRPAGSCCSHRPSPRSPPYRQRLRCVTPARPAVSLSCRSEHLHAQNTCKRIVAVAVCLGLSLSVTLTVIEYEPAAVLRLAVPYNRPPLVSLRPLGSAPTLTHLSGGMPPDAVSCFS